MKKDRSSQMEVNPIQIYESITDLIGKTPLVKLRNITAGWKRMSLLSWSPSIREAASRTGLPRA